MSHRLTRWFGFWGMTLHADACAMDRLHWLKRTLQPGPLITLDAGCGIGLFSLLAARCGNKVLGLSFDAAQLRSAEECRDVLGLSSASFTICDLREVDRRDLGRATFDQIICCETIEHILNDQKLLIDLAALLKPGGRLLLTTPYKQSKALRGDKLSTQEDGGHVRWGYTHDEMRALFNAAGLDVLEAGYLSGAASQWATNLWRCCCGISAALGRLVNAPLRIMRVLDRPLTALLRYPPLCISMIGRKH